MSGSDEKRFFQLYDKFTKKQKRVKITEQYDCGCCIFDILDMNIYDKIETLFFNCRKHFIELDKLNFELIQTKKENQNKINLIFNKINSILNREEISINEKLFYTFTPNKIKRSLTN